MSQHTFCVVKKKQPASVCKKLESIAAEHGADFIWATIPGTGWQGWFAGPDVGFPFTKAREDAVRADIEAAGLTARLWG